MKVYQIDYDLRNQRDYAALIARIKRYPHHCNPLESTWLIASNNTAVNIRDDLMQAIDKDDGLLVTQVVNAAWCGLDAIKAINAVFAQAAA